MAPFLTAPGTAHTVPSMCTAWSRDRGVPRVEGWDPSNTVYDGPGPVYGRILDRASIMEARLII